MTKDFRSQAQNKDNINELEICYVIYTLTKHDNYYTILHSKR